MFVVIVINQLTVIVEASVDSGPVKTWVIRINASRAVVRSVLILELVQVFAVPFDIVIDVPFDMVETNGSYKQCTNNYMPLPKSGNAPCETGRAGFEMASPKYKLSENCYYQSTKMISKQNKNMNQK